LSLIEAELILRLDILARAESLDSWPLLTPNEVRELGIYGGASGVWVDKSRTNALAKEGVAVGLLHTGRHYDDDIDETGVLYHYPTTQRPESRDNNEIQSIKNAKTLKLPIFVIRNIGNRKKIDLAWMDDFDDQLRICILTFHGVNPDANSYRTPQYISSLPLFGPRKKSMVEVLRADRDPFFKFNILKRFQGICLVTEINVTEMLDAAHIIPVANGGTESNENGMLLSASAHRALDSGLWAVNPNTLQIETKSGGPTAQRMKLIITDLSHQAANLNLEALEFRYERLFLKGLSK
jgi:putative restriction endonuclease